MNDTYSYEEFNNYIDSEVEEENEEREENSFIYILSVVSKWFIRIGMVVAFFVFLYYIFTGKFGMAFLFILGLVIAYWFGYGLMFLLDKFVTID